MRKYNHLHPFSRDEVSDIHLGKCYIFPKLDGANARVDINPDTGELRFGSRNGVLNEFKDLQGFIHWGKKNADAFKEIFDKLGNVTIYGEWLVPHTIKTYMDEAWKQMYIFDVYNNDTDTYLHYDDYADLVRSVNLPLIDPICTMDNPSIDTLLPLLERNTYLIKDGEGSGEGIVIKNYNWRNRWGEQSWAKLVKNSFKEDNKRAFGIPEVDGDFVVEYEIAKQFCTAALVHKERAKIEQETTERKTVIPKLLNMVWYCIITEDMWAIIKEFKNPKIDFGLLKKYVADQTKEYAKDLFGRG